MKKLNLKFFGPGAKMVLPLFLLFGLFMISAGSVSAQYVPVSKAMELVKAHVDQLPDHHAPALKKQQINTPQEVQAMTTAVESRYGNTLIHFMVQGNSVVAAFQEADKKYENFPYPQIYTNVKKVYTDLLKQ
jgi:hypothetical protein